MCWRVEHVRWASVYMGGGEVGQHCWDTIRLVPLHLMLLSWMQRAAHDRLLFLQIFWEDQQDLKMGCGPSKSDLSVVQEVTGMTKKDAKESFDGFKKQAGGSKIKLDKFTKLVSSLNTNKGKKQKVLNSLCLRLLSSTIYFCVQLIFALTSTSTTWSDKLT